MTSGRPDYTVPVSIEAITIETLPIDIKAQTLGTVSIDIAAQTVGNIDINLAASAVTLNVDITAQSLESLDITIGGGVSNIRRGHLVNPSFEEDEVGWRFGGAAAIASGIGHTGTKCVKFSAGELGQWINQTGITPPIDTDKLAALKISQAVSNISDKSTVTVYYAEGTNESTILTNTEIAVFETHDVDYTAGKFIVDVRVAAPFNPADDVWIDSVFITYTVDQWVTTVGTVDVDITAQSVGNISIDIAAQSLETLSIDIAAQTVDLNIKTSGGTNIVIDQLTQTAYTERRSTISNNGETPSWLAITGNARRGKFFPRGCRGFISTVDVYCYDTAAAGGTITVYLSPKPSIGPVYSADVTVPAGGSAAWRSATFEKMWDADSLFIWAVCSVADLRVAYDSDEDYDAYGSADAGASWSDDNLRFWFRVVMAGETVGDLPVSGTVNAVKVPSRSGSGVGTVIPVPDDTLTTVATLVGAGTVLRLLCWANHDEVEFQIFIDGDQLDAEAWVGGDVLSGEQLSLRGFTVDSEQVQLIDWLDEGAYMFALMIPYEFKRKVEVKAYHTLGVQKLGTCGIHANMLR